LNFVISPPFVRLPARSATMAEFAPVFQRSALHSPVVDKTGLTGRYAFDPKRAPKKARSVQRGGRAPDNNPRPGPFAAIQHQLGLCIEATRASFNLFVADKAEHPGKNWLRRRHTPGPQFSTANFPACSH
jgi:uncharacterized protein (TIGR03435 family)